MYIVFYEKCCNYNIHNPPGFDDMNLTIGTDMATVVKAMAQPDSGLEIRDRMWLKITIANAFIGMTSNPEIYIEMGSKLYMEFYMKYVINICYFLKFILLGSLLRNYHSS